MCVSVACCDCYKSLVPRTTVLRQCLPINGRAMAFLRLVWSVLNAAGPPSGPPTQPGAIAVGFSCRFSKRMNLRRGSGVGAVVAPFLGGLFVGATLLALAE